MKDSVLIGLQAIDKTAPGVTYSTYDTLGRICSCFPNCC